MSIISLWLDHFSLNYSGDKFRSWDGRLWSLTKTHKFHDFPDSVFMLVQPVMVHHTPNPHLDKIASSSVAGLKVDVVLIFFSEYSVPKKDSS